MSNISLQEQIELSQRTKILELIKEGKPQREIINLMGISRDTIKRRLGLRQDGVKKHKVVVNNYVEKTSYKEKNKNLIVPKYDDYGGYDWKKDFEETNNLWDGMEDEDLK